MRKLIVFSMILVLVCLSGCTFSDPRFSGTPPTPDTDPVFATEVRKSAEEIQTAWSAISGLVEHQPDESKWAAMVQTLESQWEVMVGPDPLNRIRAVNVSVGEPFRLDFETTMTSAQTALTAAVDAHTERVKVSTGLAAALWASLTASLTQIQEGLTNSYGEAVPMDPTVTIQIPTEAEAIAELIGRYDEAVFSLQAGLGFLGQGTDRDQVYRTFATFQRDWEFLIGTALDLGITPPKSPGAYALPAGRDATAVRALLVTSQHSVVEACLVWVATSEDAGRSLPFFIRAATTATSAGIGFAVWPGWPDA
ncbi:MAG: hypothetical protein LBG99_03285 [Propionibacteriaceae bacterium]|jgi:hypothetical protein|nr:hypothetical protein [Propionibacteriaceae bacterium]